MDAKQNELDKEEMREVVRLLRPDWTDEQFDKEWNAFLELKRNWKKTVH